MANPEHLSILDRGVAAWNAWRDANPEIMPNLREASLIGVKLNGVNLGRTKLRGAFLNGAELRGAKLSNSDLIRSNFSQADLSNANFISANLSRSNLSDAKLNEAYLIRTNLNSSDLSGADLSGAKMGYTLFSDTDLSAVSGLNLVRHMAPSTIGIDTLYRSQGKIPENFLRGCGVPDDFITFIPSLFSDQGAIQFYSCFISYSAKDEEFARRLHSRMCDEKLRVWFAPEDIKGGEKLHEQIERAIQIHDRLLIVLSEHSMRSKWVMTELRKACKQEVKQDRRKLFPIRLVDYETICKWECFDADSGQDLAVEVREYFIPDFSNWKDHDSFEAGFKRLLSDLRDAESQAPR